MVDLSQRDFNNVLDCPKCLTGGSVVVVRSWQNTLNEALTNVKWECNGQLKGMKCDYRHWEQIEHPEDAENKDFKELIALPVKLPPYAGRSMFGKCPRCGDENQVLHDFVSQTTREKISACVRCVTELWKLAGNVEGYCEIPSTRQTIIRYMGDKTPKVSTLIPDVVDLIKEIDPQIGPQRSATVKGKVKCEMCGKFVDRVFDRFNTWVCKSCVEICDEPDAAIIESLRKGME